MIYNGIHYGYSDSTVYTVPDTNENLGYFQLGCFLSN